MTKLIVNISANQVYDMDNHMFNWIAIAISILSGLIAIVTIGVAIYGLISFKNFKKQIEEFENKQKQRNAEMEKRMVETTNLKAKVDDNLIDIRENNVATSAIGIVNTLNKMQRGDGNTSLIISSSLDVFENSIPDHFNDSTTFCFFLNDIALLFNVISIYAGRINSAIQDEVLKQMIKIKEKVQLSNLRGSIKEDDAEKIIQFEDKINKSIEKTQKKIAQAN